MTEEIYAAYCTFCELLGINPLTMAGLALLRTPIWLR